MKILNISDTEGFFRTLEKCKGEIFLVTSEGDKLNLKSKLSQYVALSKMFTDATIDNIELETTDPEDMNMLINYLIRG